MSGLENEIIAILRFVDKVHALFPFFAFAGAIAFVESYLRGGRLLASRNYLDRFFTKFKFFTLALAASITVSQGFFAGCLIHVPQNIIANIFLGRNWSAYGLVYREFFEPEDLIYLQLFYLVLGILLTWRAYIYYKKYIVDPQKKLRLPILVSLNIVSTSIY